MGAKTFWRHGLIAGVMTITVTISTVRGAPTTINGSGYSSGIKAGFGNAVGSNSKLYVTDDTLGEINWILYTGGGNLDNANAVVIYIDTDDGATGYADTKDFYDTGSSFFDELRAATSGTNDTERTDVTFATGFKANYAITFNSGLAVIYELDAFNHFYVNTISGAGFGAGGPYHFGHMLDDIGLTSGDSFRYVLTYLDPLGAYRSNEFHGVADATVPDNNIGFDDIVLSANDFNTFHSGLAGDFNADHSVNGGDFLLVQRGLGTTHDASDLTTFQSSYGVAYAASSISAIPEPASFLLAAAACGAFAFGIRRT